MRCSDVVSTAGRLHRRHHHRHLGLQLFVALLCLASVVTSAAEYYGKYLGPLKSYHHGLGGDVYAVDARTLHIRNFVYDGEGPAAYFYGSNGKQPGVNGYRIRDEKASTNPLKRYRNEHLTITLPEGLTLHDVKWFYVWCEDFSVNFGDVKIPHNLDYPKPQKIDSLSGIHGVSSENIVVVDAQTLLIPGFSYDGEAPDAKFWVGAGDKPTPQGIRVADENGKEVPLRRYDRKTIVLTLPGDLTIFDIGHFGIWCEAFTVDFGHVSVPSVLSVPPSLKMLGVLPQSKLNCEVLHEPLGYEVRWAIAGDSIVVQLVAKLEDNQYMSFGISGSPTSNRMVGGDVVVAGVDQTTVSGFAQDYYLLDKSQCIVQQDTGQVSGSCPDSNIQGPAGESVRLLNAAIVNGYSIVTYQRPLKSKDNLDLPILTNNSQPIIWAVGPLNDKHEVSYHPMFSKETIKIDFGRLPEWNCPIPDTDAKSVAVHNEVTTVQSTTDITTTSQSSLKEVTPTKKIRPRPVPKPAPVEKNVAWDIPAIQCYEPDDGVFYAQMGPTGGKHGYSAITGHVGWGISWYINGLLIPEINVVRGQTYTFVVEGGLDTEIPAKYHPFYITDDPVGGYGYKTAEERDNIRIFSGVSVSKSGEVIPTGTGRLCNWTPDPQQPSADEFVSFGAYQRTLSLACDNGDPGIVQWTPDADTPDTVYYQCFTHRHLGWKINVVDACDKEQPSSEPTAPISEDLQSRGSIQYTTRVKPDVENKQFFNNNEPLRNYVDLQSDHKGHNMPLIPTALEENLKSDFYKSSTNRDQFVYNNYKFPTAASQQNTLYTYPNSNYTYGNVPFYMPKAHYGNPQPVTSPTYNYMLPSYNINNNNYRPIRQPVITHFQAQPNILSDHRPAQMVFTPQQPVAVKHGYRVSGKRLPPNGPMPNGAHHSVVYKKPVYKFNTQSPLPLVSHYSPVPPVSQPMLSVYPSNFQQQHQPLIQQQQQPLIQPQLQQPMFHQQQKPMFYQQQQQQPNVQQPSTSMSQSVSVSYSSSKHPKSQQMTGYVPIQSRQETDVQQHQSQGGFNPSTVVVEGGFKPILPGGSGIFEDRSDKEMSGTAGDFDETVTVRHYEKKMSKKLISRKPTVKNVDPITKEDTTNKEPQNTTVTTTENVAYVNKVNTENTTELNQTTGILVL
ncbi:protein Skeletor, isoforms B/C [Metopolophium dirhodum]|uniref:protein Skeletor, isoforms B/C n=1 Tax=Metopolophium dirhodum TaxID=44670 RepID=UPI00298F856C|nr:protein Skeletor, isoforms B/C [Metopolophium dirhodum]